jgi:hypothetical protein
MRRMTFDSQVRRDVDKVQRLILCQWMDYQGQ